MKNFWRGFRKAGYIDENKVRVQREARAKILELVELGHEAESQFVEAIKKWMPDMTKEELQARITQFHASVSERQQRGLPRH
jgi:formiminotetrahydrofolate cyclodeaminase